MSEVAKMPKKPPPVTGSLTLNQPNPKYLDKVDFAVTVSQGPSAVELNIYRDGQKIAGSGWVRREETSYTSQQFGLYAPSYTGGAAHGKADLLGFDRKGTYVIASTEFDIAP